LDAFVRADHLVRQLPFVQQPRQAWPRNVEEFGGLDGGEQRLVGQDVDVMAAGQLVEHLEHQFGDTAGQLNGFVSDAEFGVRTLMLFEELAEGSGGLDFVRFGGLGNCFHGNL
jgi:hypothetical protein